MGTDNAVNALTHRIHVSSAMGLSSNNDNDVSSSGSSPGLDLSDRRLGVDIGDIPILQQLRAVGRVGGILGFDVMSRCQMVRVRSHYRCQEEKTAEEAVGIRIPYSPTSYIRSKRMTIGKYSSR